MIKLGKLRLENFKSFEEPYEIDFTDKDLFILDGPNGFGKTTIFDAIELCLTGKVGRILNTDNKQKSTHYLKNNMIKPTDIFLELIQGTESVVVIHANIPKETTTTDNKISNHKVDLKFLKNWPVLDVNYNNLTLLNHFNLNSLIENDQFCNTFDIFKYIQQEETCHYLKNKESQRHDKISYLFGTQKQCNENEVLGKVKSKLEEKIKKNEDSISLLQKEKDEISNILIKELPNPNEIILSGKIPSLNEVEFNTNERISVYIEYIEYITWASNNYQECKDYKFNNLLNVIIENRVKEIKNLIKFGRIDDFEKIKKNERHVVWLNDLKLKIDDHYSSLTLFSNNYNLDVVFFDRINSLYPLISSKYTTQIQEYIKLNKELGDYQNTLNKLLTSMADLRKHYELHIGDQGIGIPCPFCGDFKESIQILWDNYNLQYSGFTQLKSLKHKSLDAIAEKLKSSLIVECIEKSEKFIKKYERYLSFLPYLSSQITTKDAWARMDNLRSWLNDNFIDTSSLIQPHNVVYSDTQIDCQLNLILELIRESVRPTSKSKNYQDIKRCFNALNLVISEENILNEDSLVVTLSDLKQDFDFLKFKQLQLNSKRINEIEMEVVKLSKVSSSLHEKRDLVRGIFNKYTACIKDYEKSVAQQISIPFYIYSSKILQTRPDGNGAFLKSAKNVRDSGFIRFVSNLNDDHDAWNTMSSGQLSGLVISFTLAMNKVYPNRFSTLLIDDPVQTMDEINLASLVQLLRNEFSSYQLIISTHERKTSNYFSYKYQLHDKTKLLNLKEERLNS